MTATYRAAVLGVFFPAMLAVIFGVAGLVATLGSTR